MDQEPSHGQTDSTIRERTSGNISVRPDGSARTIPIADFHKLPRNTPQVENALEPGELIVAVSLPKAVGGTHVYRKL